MGHVGHYGKLDFYVRTKNGKLCAQSFDNAKWETSINVEEHKRYGYKPLLEVVDRNCDEFTMDIYFYAGLGVSPWKKLMLLREYNLKSKVYPLGIGRRRIGGYKFLITKISNDLRTFYKNGKLLAVVASVTFTEYPYKKGKVKRKKLIHTSSEKGKSSKTSATTKASAATKTSARKGYSVYVVKKGDTLWGLAKKYYGKGAKYSKIFNANKTKAKGFDVIRSPDKLQPGWKIKIPK